MSFASMQGRSMYIGSTIGEGALRFSDGTVQQTAYPGASGDITCENLTVSESAIIGSSGTSDDRSLTIYGTVAQQLSNSQSTQYGSNSLTNVTTGAYNTAVGYGCLQKNTSGGFNTAMGNSALNLIDFKIKFKTMFC